MLNIKSISFLFFFSFLLVSLIIPPCSYAEPQAPGDGMDWWYLLAFIFGVLTGMAEILSKYRDEPWKASKSRPGIIYMALNGFVSIVAYWIVLEYKVFTAIDSPGVSAAIAAGFGSMAILRSKIFVYKTQGGEEYPIGPDIVLTIFMKNIDREIDRKQALRRQNLVSEEMSDISDFNKAAEYFDTSLLSFQNLTDEERENFKIEIENLKNSDLDDRIKIFALGYALLNLTGEGNFKQFITGLKKYIG